MATFKQGILGGFSGKVGGVIGSSWKGIDTMRSQPSSVTNPRTNAQVANRSRFKSVSQLAAAMLTTIVKPLNDRFAQKMSGFNDFCQRNAGAFDALGAFVPANLVLSRGKLSAPAGLEHLPSVDSEVVVTFSLALTGSFDAATDKVYAVVLGKDGDILGVSSGLFSRAGGTVSVSTPDRSAIYDPGTLYLSFLRADGTQVSNSSYIALS